MVDISDKEFFQFQRFIYEAAGISLSIAKKALVGGRLSKRLQLYRLSSYTDYFDLLSSGDAPEEVQSAIDLLTTNETYFFREPKHFDVLREQAMAPRQSREFRVWSAASSSGEEAYSIAMVLADCLSGRPWEVIGSDISARVLERAMLGHYSMERTQHIPREYLRRFCLKGIGAQQNTLLIDPGLSARVRFLQVKLNAALPQLGTFDAIFMRNVLIYFDLPTKRQVVHRVTGALKPGGFLYIGHSESLNGVSESMSTVVPAVYRKG